MGTNSRFVERLYSKLECWVISYLPGRNCVTAPVMGLRSGFPVEGKVIVCFGRLNLFFQDKDRRKPLETGMYLRSLYPLDNDSNFAGGYPDVGKAEIVPDRLSTGIQISSAAVH